jgi:Uma2 family endonuclease
MSILTLEMAETMNLTEQPTDPYLYGWRYVTRFAPDGEMMFVLQPLTLEDILHPQEDDHRMHAHYHEQICHYLGDVFTSCLGHDPTAKVLADVRIGWDNPTIKSHTPDISVVFGVSHEENWTTFYEAEEGVRPTLVVEVTSPSTRLLDLVNKFDEYELVGLKYYIIVDQHQQGGEEQRRVLGYRLNSQGRYVMLEPNEQGWLWLEPIGIWLAWQGETLVCYDKASQLIPNYTTLREVQAKTEAKAEAKVEVAEAKAQAEATARAELEARLQQLEAELRRLQGNR